MLSFDNKEMEFALEKINEYRKTHYHTRFENYRIYKRKNGELEIWRTDEEDRHVDSVFLKGYPGHDGWTYYDSILGYPDKSEYEVMRLNHFCGTETGKIMDVHYRTYKELEKIMEKSGATEIIKQKIEKLCELIKEVKAPVTIEIPITVTGTPISELHVPQMPPLKKGGSIEI